MHRSLLRHRPLVSQRSLSTSVVAKSRTVDEFVARQEVATRIVQVAALSPTPVSLKSILQLKAIDFAEFLRCELPIRLAHRIQDLDTIPGLSAMQAVRDVQAIYCDSFQQLLDIPPIQNDRHEREFANLLKGLYNKHSCVLVEMAKGAYQLRQQQGDPLDEQQVFLDRFYMSRIGIRFLAGQFLTLHDQQHPDRRKHLRPPHVTGMIDLQTRPYDCIQTAIADARLLCRQHYGRCPKIEIIGDAQREISYIPSYLSYIVLELLKNALRATMEHHRQSRVLPPVQVMLSDGSEDVIIKIADQGGGIPRSAVTKIWSYLFTTAPKTVQKSFLEESKLSNPMAGLGYGLPISRSFCRYFGGDLDVISMEGYGTDAFVYLRRLCDSLEPVPASTVVR